MHRAYTKRLEEIRGVRDKAALVDRFWSDPAFARESIQSRAQQLGITLPPTAGASAPAGTGTSGAEPPREFLAAIEAKLSPELRWMAPALASATWEATRSVVAPLQQRTQ